jgi:23S rRNA (uracil1939-C5)-methyltransferase
VITDLRITDIALGGKGVGRIEGKAVFVPYVIDGETVSVGIARERRKFIEAELKNVQVASSHRVEPPCPYFGRCGGCVYQHIDYAHQLVIKTRQVQQTLARIGGISAPVRPIIPSPLPYEYRNRITVHVRDGVIGFFRRESNTLLDIERCPISSPQVNASLAELRVQHPRDGHYSLRDHDAARVFTQANNSVAALLLDLVDGLFESSGGTLVDAYCGAGFFAKRLRARFASVIGIDWDLHAIAIAQRDAGAEEKYIAGNVEEELARVLQSTHSLIVDPPAAGLSQGVRNAIIHRQPSRLIYVSCNPATLARDLAALTKTYEIDSITPLDMFPQTAEIETVVSLRSKT